MKGGSLAIPQKRVKRMSKIIKALFIGSGPIVIGQTAEFDCAGTQACKALREEGVNSVTNKSIPEIFFDYYRGGVGGLAE